MNIEIKGNPTWIMGGNAEELKILIDAIKGNTQAEDMVRKMTGCNCGACCEDENIDDVEYENENCNEYYPEEEYYYMARINTNHCAIGRIKISECLEEDIEDMFIVLKKNSEVRNWYKTRYGDNKNWYQHLLNDIDQVISDLYDGKNNMGYGIGFFIQIEH